MSAARMLRVEVRPLLNHGTLGADSAGRPVILIDSEQLKSEQALTFWHEIVHLILSASAEPTHDEAEVERIAQRLHAAWPGALRRVVGDWRTRKQANHPEIPDTCP